MNFDHVKVVLEKAEDLDIDVKVISLYGEGRFQIDEKIFTLLDLAIYLINHKK